MFSHLHHKDNPVVLFDISINNQKPYERIFIELFADIVPKTAENFRQLCTGEQIRNNQPIGYKHTFFHRIVPDFVIQGGDFVFHNGKGSYSIYGETFPDENFIIKHDQPGIVSMANTGPNTNGCQFFITLAPCSWLDGKHVAFGKVNDLNSLNVIKRIEKIKVDDKGLPFGTVEIVQCGQM
jgi:peptidyl-prolyl isomerase H (cyclophilin H)